MADRTIVNNPALRENPILQETCDRGVFEKAARYVRTHSARDLWQDIEQCAQDRPALTILSAVGFGFIVGRALLRR
jgi:hypothetical protein